MIVLGAVHLKCPQMQEKLPWFLEKYSGFATCVKNTTKKIYLRTVIHLPQDTVHLVIMSFAKTFATKSTLYNKKLLNFEKATL